MTKERHTMTREKRIPWNKLPAADRVGLPPESDLRKLRLPPHPSTSAVRIFNCLVNAHVRSLAELQQETAARLLTVKNFGKGCLHDLEVAMSELGLELRDSSVRSHKASVEWMNYARGAALQRLIARHNDEFAGFLKEELERSPVLHFANVV